MDESGTFIRRFKTHPILATIALSIRESNDSAELFTTIISLIRHALQADRALIYSLDSVGKGTVSAESTAGDWPQLKDNDSFNFHLSQSWEALSERIRNQSSAGAHIESQSGCHIKFLEQFQIKANLVVPLWQKKATRQQLCQTEVLSSSEESSAELWGFLCVHQCSEPRQWQSADINLVDQVAVQLELGIQQIESCKTVQPQQLLEQVQVNPGEEIAAFKENQIEVYRELNETRQVLAREIRERQRTERTFIHEKALIQTMLNSIDDEVSMQTILDSVGDGVVSTDVNGNIQYMNPKAEQILGWKLHEVEGFAATDVFKLLNELTRRPVENSVSKTLRSGLLEKMDLNTVLLSRDGTEYPIEDSAAPIRENNGEMLGVVLTFRDVTHSRSLARQSAWHANHDELTGLFNRRAFEQCLTNSLIQARTLNHIHTLCYIDLDRFKFVNDACGHAAGDQLLQEITALLKGQIRQSDVLARLGGDEFGLLLHQCNLVQAERVAENLRALVQDFRFVWQSKEYTIGMSVGLVCVDSESVNFDSLLKSADAACYSAKEKGRNRIHAYHSKDDEIAQKQSDQEWLYRIQEALNQNRFCLYHQKIAALSEDSQVEHSEVLLRLNGEQGEQIAACKFIPAAERYQLISAIDKWVIQNFLSNYSASTQIHSEGPSPKHLYNINLSGESINDETFLPFLKAQLNKYKIPTDTICFEITENTAIKNLKSASQFINSVKEIGCSFALDDFGSGMSSLSYLKHLPIDYLKIDGSFIKDIISNKIDYAMVESFNYLSHLMGIQTIAECVEDQNTFTTLKKIGVNYAQGYGISRPCPLTFC